MNPRVFFYFCSFALRWLRTNSLLFSRSCRQNVAVHQNCLCSYILKFEFVRSLFWASFDGYSDESALVQKRCKIHKSFRYRAELLYISKCFSLPTAQKLLGQAPTTTLSRAASASSTTGAKIQFCIGNYRVVLACYFAVRNVPRNCCRLASNMYGRPVWCGCLALAGAKTDFASILYPWFRRRF